MCAGHGRETVNQLSPKKLLHTKWTAAKPVNREKHFLVTEVHEDDEGNPQTVTVQAVYSKKERVLDWRELKDDGQWRRGWV